MNDFKVILEAMIDNSSLTNVQKQLAKERLKINADISIEDFAKSKQELEKQIGELAKNIQKILGNAVTDKQASQWAKQYYDGMVSGAKEAEKAQNALTDAMARGREKAEQARIAEEKASNKRQQLAAANAVNKELEEEYEQRQKNIEAARKQAELDKQNALAFTKSASERLSSAISKYSYGDTSNANAMMKQMNRGLSNFGDLSNVQGNITQLSSTVDKIIADLKISHEQSLQALNEEIRAEQTLQSQKDAFNKKNINAIDYEIQKREEEAKAFSSMLQAQMQEQQKMQSEVNKIQLLMSGEGQHSYSLELARITEQYKRLGLEGDKLTKANENVKALEKAHNELAEAIAKDISEYGSLEAKNKAIISADENRIAVLNRVTNEYKEMALTAPRILTDVQRLNKVESMQKWADNNSKAVKKYGNDINRIIERFAQLEIQMNSIESDKLVAEFKEIQNQARKTGNIGMTAADKLKNAWGKFGGWSLATGALTKVWYGMKSVYEASIELDGAVTDLTMATGANKEQIDSLIDSYSDLAEELNATITDVVISGTEWLKQGKSIAETETLIRNSMILSKIAKLDSVDSTTYLTSVMKGYKVAAEDTLNVVDKLSAVDMASATNVGGLAEGMSEVASSADLAGVSMDKLLGYLAAVGEVTQNGMSETGTTFNAIFSRMGNIKLARLKDYQNSGEDLSNVETVLRGEGILLRDSSNEFRNFGKVLDEVAGRWTSFSEVSQRAIASAFAGTHHMNEFIVLMENYGKALEYTEVSMNSSGEAMEKFDDYQESVAAHTELFNKSLQDLANTAIDSGLVNFFIDLGTFGIKALEGILDTLTPLGTLLTGLGGVGVYQFVKNFD